MGLPKERTALTDLVNAMLDTAGLSKEWWGDAILTACHVLKRVPTKNKEITPFEEWEKKDQHFHTYVHGVVWQK